jgi:type 1 fimbriae regulatory protein FimB
VRRANGGGDGQHPISGREIRGLRKLRRQQPVGARYKLLAKAPEAAGHDDLHPHLLRHGRGFKLVNAGMDTLPLAAYLGHTNVQNTKRYARINATRFNGIWRG